MYGNGIELPAEPPPSDDERTSRGPLQHSDAQYGSAAADKRATVKAFLALSKKRWQTSDAASSTFRKEMRRDQLFAWGNGNQWETEDKQARAEEGRPCIEINRIPQFIRQVSNQNRANRSQIQINPRGKGGTVELAAAIQGLVRSIEIESDADVAYDTATEHQLRSGLGFVRLRAAWASDDSDEMVCRISRIRNPLSVYWDPSTQEADFSDCRWMHIIGAIGKDEYEARWGKVSNNQWLGEFMAGTQGGSDDWLPEGKVFISEYYYVDVEERTLLIFDTGDRIWQEEEEHFQEMYALANPGAPPAQVIRERLVKKRIVRWCFHNGVEILEGNKDKTAGRELPGQRIPIYPLMGDEIDLDGQVDYKGMVRDARDPQKMYNFWSSSIAEAVALAPKAPWVAAKGQIEMYMNDWKDANRKPKAVLTYDPKAVGDQLVPPPQRNVVEPAIQAMVQGLAEADRDLMSVMGLFQPSLGERGSHTESGKAREALVQQGNVANSNYLDNLQRTKRAIGRSLLEWIPIVYDVARLQHLLKPDGKKLEAVIYSGAANKPDPAEFPGVEKMFNVGVGHFEVSVSTGPSFQSERQATEAWLLELFKVLPGLAAIGADIVLENSDNPAAMQLAERAKKALPPQFQDQGDPAAQLPMLQAKVAQQTALLDKAHTAIMTMAKVLDTKQLDNDTKKEIAIIQAEAGMAQAMAKIGSEQSIEAFQAEFQRYQQTVEMIHAETVAGMQQDHEREMQAEQQAHAQDQQDASQAHDIDKIGAQGASQIAVQAAAPKPAAPAGA